MIAARLLLLPNHLEVNAKALKRFFLFTFFQNIFLCVNKKRVVEIYKQWTESTEHTRLSYFSLKLLRLACKSRMEAEHVEISMCGILIYEHTFLVF